MSLRESPEPASTSVYHNQRDRDISLEASYQLSDVLRAALELPARPASILAMVAQHVTDLAELFWREASLTGGVSDAVKFDSWCSRHFGRQLEPSARGLLWGEVRYRKEGVTSRSGALWDSWGEQQRYERAASQVGPFLGGSDENALAHIERIVKLATGKTVDELKPPRPLSKRQWEARKKLLLEQAERRAKDEEGQPV
jgi:hypothetical protein